MTTALTIFGFISIVASIYLALRFVPVMKRFSAFMDKVAKNYASN